MGREEICIRAFVDIAGDSLSSMKILIVGLGAIGAGIGVSTEYESHLSVTKELGFELVGGVDIDPTRQKEFSTITGKPAFGDLAEALSTSPNIITIATRPENHLESLTAALKYFPKSSVVCEKPFGSNGSESKKMFELIGASETNSYVNYSRQFSRGFLTLKKNIKGDLMHGSVVYNHGLARSCSHYIRLCLGLFGPVKEVRNISHQGNSNNPSFQFLFENLSTINFMGVQDSHIRIADFLFVTTRETITISEAMNWKIFKSKQEDFPKWARELEAFATGDLSGGFKELYKQILNNGEIDKLTTSILDAWPNSIIDQILTHD